MSRVINEAMVKHEPAFNPFTMKLAELIKAHGEVRVVLRDGGEARIAHLDMDEQSFFTIGWNLAWRLDGSSCQDSRLDIISMEIPA